MFQKISGNIISGRSRDILWRSLEIYRKKPGTHSSKIGKAIFRILKKSKSLEADIAISQLPKNQSFWPCHCPHGWWTPRASSASSSQDPGELRQSETPAFAPGTGPQVAAFFFWGGGFGVFMCHFPIIFPMGFVQNHVDFHGFSHWFPMVFRVVLPMGAVQGGAVKIWEHDFLVLRFFFVYPTRQRNSNMPIISLCIAFVLHVWCALLNHHLGVSRKIIGKIWEPPKILEEKSRTSVKIHEHPEKNHHHLLHLLSIYSLI